MKEVVVVSGCRTAIGNFGGALKSVPAVELGSIVMRETLNQLSCYPAQANYMRYFIYANLSLNGIKDPSLLFLRIEEITLCLFL